jgi:hypothetical protein
MRRQTDFSTPPITYDGAVGHLGVDIETSGNLPFRKMAQFTKLDPGS